jgi:hypothetical protein
VEHMHRRTEGEERGSDARSSMLTFEGVEGRRRRRVIADWAGNGGGVETCEDVLSFPHS